LIEVSERPDELIEFGNLRVKDVQITSSRKFNAATVAVKSGRQIEDWLENLEFSIRNKSDKQITYIQFELQFPDTGVTGPLMVYREFGIGVHPQSAGIPKDTARFSSKTAHFCSCFLVASYLLLEDTSLRDSCLLRYLSRRHIMRTQFNFRFYSIASVLLFLSVVIASQSSGNRSRIQTREQESSIKPIERIEDLRIINKTSAFSVLEIKKISDNLFEITYKNDYSKTITGFEVSVGGMRIQTELILGGDERQFIFPGNTFQKAYAAQEGLERDGIQILAVVFDDGSNDGEIRYVKEITDYRLGMKTERQRVLTLLEQVITSKNQDISTELGELETGISSTAPSTQQESRLDNVELGIRNERRRMLDEIRILRDKHRYAMVDDGKARQLKEDLLIVKAISENIIRLASLSSRLQRSSQ
jgi:hypothetical protein